VGVYAPTFRLQLHRGIRPTLQPSQHANPNHDRFCVIVPVTVGRATSAAGGRCRPARTGNGVVPWRYSRIVGAP